MKRCCLLILWLLCFYVSKGTHYLPEAIRIESKRLYQVLNLSNTISLSAFQNALAGYGIHKNSQEYPLLVVIDFTKPSTEERFCVIDLKAEKVLFTSHVTHGLFSGENYATSFSNQPGSYKSSLGFFRTGDTYIGRNGYSLFLDGLEKGVNDNARQRAIVIHGADYADPTILKNQKRLGRSLGCPALPPAISQKVIDTIKNGSILYIYGKAPQIANSTLNNQTLPPNDFPAYQTIERKSLSL